MARKHLDLRPREPKGTKNRRWVCLDCGEFGTLDELMKGTCKTEEPLVSDDQRILDAINGVPS